MIKNTRLIFFVLALALSLKLFSNDAKLSFTPPDGWRYAETSTLPKSVKMMVVGKGSGVFPPSINVAVEPYNGSIQDYLKIVKNINSAKKAQWKNLGTLKTRAGDGNLSQVDLVNEWGNVRMMHFILKKDQNIYILTAAATKQDFSQFYKQIFNALRSFAIDMQ